MENPTVDELLVVAALLELAIPTPDPLPIQNLSSFTWGRKRQRTAVVSLPHPLPPVAPPPKAVDPLPRTEEPPLARLEDAASPASPLAFLAASDSSSDKRAIAGKGNAVVKKNKNAVLKENLAALQNDNAILKKVIVETKRRREELAQMNLRWKIANQQLSVGEIPQPPTSSSAAPVVSAQRQGSAAVPGSISDCSTAWEARGLEFALNSEVTSKKAAGGKYWGPRYFILYPSSFGLPGKFSERKAEATLARRRRILIMRNKRNKCLSLDLRVNGSLTKSNVWWAKR